LQRLGEGIGDCSDPWSCINGSPTRAATGDRILVVRGRAHVFHTEEQPFRRSRRRDLLRTFPGHSDSRGRLSYPATMGDPEPSANGQAPEGKRGTADRGPVHQSERKCMRFFSRAITEWHSILGGENEPTRTGNKCSPGNAGDLRQRNRLSHTWAWPFRKSVRAENFLAEHKDPKTCRSFAQWSSPPRFSDPVPTTDSVLGGLFKTGIQAVVRGLN